MKITVEDGGKTSFSESGSNAIEVCFNALRGLGLSDESILKGMYTFSKQFIKEEEPKTKK